MTAARTAAAVVVAGACAAAPATAQEAAATDLRRLLEGHVRVLDVRADAIAGPGAAWLIEQGAGAEFFMVGERHGVRQVPWLVGGLLDGLTAHGYTVLAVEVSPAEARRLERLAAEAEDAAAFVEAATALGRQLPYYAWPDEARLLHRAVAGQRVALWGFDQEFAFGGARTVAELPAAAGKGAALDRLHRRARSADSIAIAGRSSGDSFVISAAPAAFDTLTSLVADEPLARRDVDQLAESSAIYRLFRAGQVWESNERRERLMRTNMTTYFDSAAARGQPRPRVLAKGGAFHFYRGMRPQTWTWTLGNFLQELAFARGGDSFNIRVFPGPGSRGFGDLERAWRSGGAAELVALAREDAAVVVDLRPLRPALAAGRLEAGDALRTLVWGYDAAVFFGGADAVPF